jgi:hypothetical protein
MAGTRGLTDGGAGARGSASAAPDRRATLTIGEAAARLAAEFPGVTVAVLRRLEAAGRFTAGRGPSGYRRYSEADLDLIRILLCEFADGAQGPLQERAAANEGTADIAGGHSEPEPAETPSAESAQARPFAAGQARRPAPGGGQRLAARTSARPARAAAGARASTVRPAAATRSATPAITALFDGGAPPAEGSRAGGPPPTAPNARPGGAAPSGRIPAQTTAAAPTRRADRRWPDAEFFAPDLGEVALDRDQLAVAARTDRAWVDGLVEYGLLPGAPSAGGADLLVARASAELAQFGVEPRHLRAVAASAARVAELIATATATGAGRETARRERALLAATGRGAEAAAAAVRLHAALVRAALLRG